MDEHAIAAKTRDLEQEYITQVFRNHTQQIQDLKKEIFELEERSKNESGADSTVDQLNDQIQALLSDKQEREIESRRDKDELEKVRRDLEAANTRLADLQEENGVLKKKQRELEEACTPAAGNEGAKGREKSSAREKLGKGSDLNAVSSLMETQNEIYRLVKEFAEIHSDYKTRVSKLEASVERYRKNEIKLEEEVQKLKNRGEGADHSALRKKICDLEAEIDSFDSKKYQTEKDQTVIKDQKDTIVLLQDSVSSKEKIIEKLTGQIDKLKNQTEYAHGDDIIKPQRSMANPFGADVQPGGGAKPRGANKSKNACDEVLEQKKPRKQTKGLLDDSKKKTDSTKLVSVENLIRDDNKSFFNNLSFTNSSPAVDKKVKKNTK